MSAAASSQRLSPDPCSGSRRAMADVTQATAMRMDSVATLKPADGEATATRSRRSLLA